MMDELAPPEPDVKCSALGISQVWAWSHRTKGEIRGVPTGTGYFTSGQKPLVSMLTLKKEAQGKKNVFSRQQASIKVLRGSE